AARRVQACRAAARLPAGRATLAGTGPARARRSPIRVAGRAAGCAALAQRSDAGADAQACGRASRAAVAAGDLTPRPAWRPARGRPCDPCTAGGAQGALVAGRGPGRPLLSAVCPRTCLGSLAGPPTAPRLDPRPPAHQHRLPFAADLEQVDGIDQRAQAAVTVVARVERALVVQMAAHRA